MHNQTKQISNDVYQALIKPLFADIKKFTLDTLFPISCLSCGAEEGEFICLDCKTTLESLDSQRCISCQKPAIFGMTHTGCQTPHGADGLISFFDYHDDKVAKILIKGKYSLLPQIYTLLGKIAAEKIIQYHSHLLYNQNFMLCPVPLHPFRQRWRGFNQAELLCQALATELNLRTVVALKRIKLTQTQKDLSRARRLENLKNAFMLEKGVNIKHKNLLLVDDVTTTGATLWEATKILKRNGAKKVICLTLAAD